MMAVNRAEAGVTVDGFAARDVAPPRWRERGRQGRGRPPTPLRRTLTSAAAAADAPTLVTRASSRASDGLRTSELDVGNAQQIYESDPAHGDVNDRHLVE